MLMLTRYRNERITLVVPPSTEPTTIEMLVGDLQRGKVKLGFTAPRAVEILRNEIRGVPNVGIAEPVPQEAGVAEFVLRAHGDTAERGPGADPLCDTAGDVHHQAHTAG